MLIIRLDKIYIEIKIKRDSNFNLCRQTDINTIYLGK